MIRKKRVLLSVVLLVLCALAASAQDSQDWLAVKSLLGEWTADKTGAPGEPSGGFSFKPDLQGRVLVRRNWAEYPATKEKPVFRHDDLMIVFRQADGKVRADYFDNEGHLIHYSVQASPDGKQITFLSDTIPSAPRFRLTNTLVGVNKMKIKFEIAPPGKPDQFAPYIEASATRH